MSPVQSQRSGSPGRGSYRARQDRAGELVLDFPLDVETSRRLRAYAAAQGITPQRLVGLLAERAGRC
ncbi:hypothetical protein [Streptomyces sp. SS8]